MENSVARALVEQGYGRKNVQGSSAAPFCGCRLERETCGLVKGLSYVATYIPRLEKEGTPTTETTESGRLLAWRARIRI